MPRPSQVGPGTEAGKLILMDFKNWKTTGFKPWGQGVGGSNHYLSRKIYQTVTSSAFRRQAQKIALMAIDQMPACEVECMNRDIGMEDKDEKNFVVDSINKNPWDRFEHADGADESEEDSTMDDNSDNEFMPEVSEEESVDSLDGFEDFDPAELKSFMSAFVSEYPCGEKLLVVFPLDGNVLDPKANHFEFVDEDTIVRRWSKVPKELENARTLLGIEKKEQSTQVDLVVLEAEIKRRLKANEHKRDKNGDIWEVRETLTLPFKCHPVLFNKMGRELSTFRKRQNNSGFAWGYFWLKAWKPPKRKQPKRIGGKRVSVRRRDDASIYTEKTVGQEI